MSIYIQTPENNKIESLEQEGPQLLSPEFSGADVDLEDTEGSKTQEFLHPEYFYG